VVQGQGIARVLKTGIYTEMGKIGKALESINSTPTALNRETGKIVRNMTAIGLFLCTIVVVVYGLTNHNWPEGFLAGLTLAMAMMPEEFPVVMTIFLALGAWRISRNRVLTRKVPAVETLGSATVLCVDKTGTLTLNRMSVSQIYANGEFYDVKQHRQEGLPENFHELVEFSILASQRDPFDPMEKALRRLGKLNLTNTEHLHDDWTLVQEYPLSHELLALSHVWKSPDDRDYTIAAKGAPEAIADLCHFTEAQSAELSERVTQMANAGLRVLGVARANFQKVDLPTQQHAFVFKFIGLVGFADPVRPNVADSIRECYDAGIRVIMITGDYPGTARNIAHQIGLTPSDAVLTGVELDSLNDSDLQERIKNINIFARVVPEQKLRLVQALKANGEVVAMTGDGVNDAPALKAANIGIAMGGRGTDVAREASDLVLVDDDFSSIVQAVKMGRRIFDNLKKAMAYIFAIHVPIAGLSLLPVLFKWPLMLLPVHIVFLELIIDPACSVVFEAEPGEKDIMKRRPRRLRDPLLSRRTLALSILQGLGVLISAMAVYLIAGHGFNNPANEDNARALGFTTLIIANLGLILTNRSWTQTTFATLRSKNPAVWWVVGGAALFLFFILYIPAIKNMFHFSVLHPKDFLVCLACGLGAVVWFEIFKFYTQRRNH
jgi:Ca2+-transporting ATPase